MSEKFKIGIDYGGTKIEGILLNTNGEKMERNSWVMGEVAPGTDLVLFCNLTPKFLQYS